MPRLNVGRARCLLLIAGGGWLAGVFDPAAAQPSSDESLSQPGQADTIVVRGRRSFDDRFNNTASTVTVTRQDIEAMGATSIAEVLRQVPGLQVTTTANGGVEIRMRGMSSSNTRILIDGAPASSTRRDVQMPLDELPAELIERIEVQRSPTAQFEGAAGGTVNIVLRQAQTRRETLTWLSNQNVWGKNALQGFVSMSGPLTSPFALTSSEPSTPAVPPVWTYFMSLTGGVRNLGSDTRRISEVSAQPAVFSVSEEQSRMRNESWSFNRRMTGRLSANHQVNIRTLISRLNQDGLGQTEGSGLSGTDPTRFVVGSPWQYNRGTGQLGLDWTYRFASMKLDTTVGFERNHSIYRLQRTSENTVAAATSTRASSLDDDRLERVWLANSKLAGVLGDVIWTVGADLDQRGMRVGSTAVNDSVVSDTLLEATIRRTALWAQTEWPLDAWKTTVTTGLRAQNYDISANQTSGNLDYQRLYWQPTINSRTRLGENTQLRWNLARTTRVPRIWELIERPVPTTTVNSAGSPDYSGNATLRPESTIAMDIGLDQRFAAQGQAGINLFVRSQSDVIARRLTLNSGRWTEQPDNVGDAMVWGIESDIRTSADWLGFGPGWNWSANASLLQSRMRSGDNQGSRIPGQARYLVNTSLVKPLRYSGGWYGGATLGMVGASDLDQPAAAGTSVRGGERSHVQLDLYIGSVIPNLGFWRLNVYNITDWTRDQRRVIVDGNGIVYTDLSQRRLTPRVFFTVGTRF